MQEAILQNRRVPENRDGLKDLRVLFLPKNSRTRYFQSFLSAARRRENWRTSVVCPQPSSKYWRDVVGEVAPAYCFVPDFTEVQAWEADSEKVAEIDAFIAKCERHNNVSAAMVLLAGERGLGRGLSLPNYNWFPNRTARQSLADNTAPFRLLRRRFAFARECLETVKPDLLLAGEWADPLCFAFYLSARLLGIRCLVHRPSKLWSGNCYWSEDPMAYNLATRLLTEEKREQRAPVSDRARQRIASFRATPATLGYVQQNWNESASRKWLLEHVYLAKLFAVLCRYHLLRQTGPRPKPPLPLALEHYRRPVLKWRQSRFFRRYSEQELQETRYLFIALHKEPEQALNYQAPFWVNQMNTVALLSAALPAGYKLLVREHRLNSGRRPTRYYREMSCLPGVVLVDSFDSQFKYIRHADLVVTDNGSTGWEGLLLGRRVITLADNFFQSVDLACRVRDPEQLAATVVDVLERPAAADGAAYDDALGWLIDAEWVTSAPMDDSDHTGSLDLIAAALAGLTTAPPEFERA